MTSHSPQSHSRRASVKTIWLLALLPVLLAGGAFAYLFSRAALPPSSSQPPSFSELRPALPAGVRERAAYTVVGNKVFVNNTICAHMGSPLSPEFMGKFTSEVFYDGPIEKFKGKTLIFNQCCEHCAEKFPRKWAAERDQIMLAHGLSE